MQSTVQFKPKQGELVTCAVVGVDVHCLFMDYVHKKAKVICTWGEFTISYALAVCIKEAQPKRREELLARLNTTVFRWHLRRQQFGHI
jgi:hypothetical protein